MSKKNIDDLFQEKLKDFGEIPDEKVWKAISSSLDKQKKSKKAVPFWWKVGGLAAGFALLFYLVNPWENTVTQEDAITTKEEKRSPSINRTEPSKDNLFEPPSKENEILVDVNKTRTEDFKKNTQKPLNKIFTNPVAESQKTILDSNSKSTGTIDNKGESIANSESSRPTENLTLPDLDNKTKVVAKDDEHPKTNKTFEDGQTKVSGNLESIVQIEAKEEETKKKSIFEAIEEQEKEEAIAEERKEKWSVGPSVAPVYFNAMGEGSPIHSNFVSNSKSGQTNLSYGMVVSYELSKKIQIRTGIHKANYGYNTNEIEFSSSADIAPNALISNIDYAMASRSVVVNSRKTEAFNDPAIATDALASSSNREGLMAQNFGYLEVPLELNYALLDKKFGINLIGGISSLFLTDNSISLESGGLETEVGEANNLNTVNFSTNIGFGVNYKFTPQLQLNVEPLFKYQLNTFSQTSGTFNPFSIGIYSGINFKF